MQQAAVVFQRQFAVDGKPVAALANAQPRLAGMGRALGQLRESGELLESSGLVSPFAERQRLVDKPRWDALEARYQG